MGVSVESALIDALYAAATAALPGVQVFDGPNLASNRPGDFLMIGVDAVPDEEDIAAIGAEWTQRPGPFATARPRDQEGEIPCLARSWDGDGVWKSARDGVHVITDAVENLVRANPTLGVTGVLWTGYGSNGALMQTPTQNGALVDLAFRIAFRARI